MESSPSLVVPPPRLDRTTATAHLTMKTPILLLLDNLLSEDNEGVWNTLCEMKQRLPPAVTGHLPTLLTATTTAAAAANHKQLPASFPTVGKEVILAHLSTYLQTFPHQAVVASTKDGSLPLHFAASSGDANLCQIVWQAFPTGAMTPNFKGKIPLHYAAREGRTAVVHFLLQVAPQTAAMASGKDKLALHFAAGEGHLEVVQALLRVYPQGACLPSAKGKLPLHFCSRWGHQTVALELLREYPNAIRALDWEGSLPLHEASREGQVSMARFLVDRFPEAVATANIRNELPLLRAIHTNNLELVLLLLQIWPQGASHVLQHVTVDDRVASWNPAILEALLRAVVDFWDGFVPWHAQPPSFVRLHAMVNHVLPVEGDESDQTKTVKKKEKKKKEKHPSAQKTKKPKGSKVPKDVESSEVGTIEDRQARLWTAGPFTSIRVERMEPTATPTSETARSGRSKSPILDRRDEARPAVRPRKRVRSSYRLVHAASAEEDASSEESGPPWHPLQAALLAHATLPVLKHTQQLFPGTPLDVTDSRNRSLFHLSLENNILCNDDSKGGGADWILEHLYRPAWCTLRETEHNALPLHTALKSRASSRLVEVLLRANPSSAVDRCGTHDQWHSEKPLAMACQQDCDYTSVYLLLRADPSSVVRESDNKDESSPA